MKLQKLLSYTRQAIDKYDLIEQGDKILVGLSGGKDSIALLYALSHLQHFYPIPFSVYAVTVDMGFPSYNTTMLQTICEQLQVEFIQVKTEIAGIVFEQRKEAHPCALCAKLRRGALLQEAQRFGCNKIAYGHHKDDVIETMMMSLFFEGRFSSFGPYTYFPDQQIAVIRPLIYVSENEIIGFMNQQKLIPMKNPCPADHHTKREEMKQLIKQLNSYYPDIKKRLFTAVEHSKIDDWNMDIMQKYRGDESERTKLS